MYLSTDRGYTNPDVRCDDPIFAPRLKYDLEYLRNGVSRPSGNGPEPLFREDDPHRAVLVTSKITAEYDDYVDGECSGKAPSLHLPCFDLDYAFNKIKVIESASGNSHLYMNIPMSWEDVCVLLDAFEKVGIVEPGYVKACKEQQMTRLRMPGVTKIPAKWAGYKDEEV